MNTVLFYGWLLCRSAFFFVSNGSFSFSELRSFWQDQVTDHEAAKTIARIDLFMNHLYEEDPISEAQAEQDAEEFMELFSGQAPNAWQELQYLEAPRQAA